MEIFGVANLAAANPVETYLSRSHSGEVGPNFLSQLLSYNLPLNLTGSATPVTGTSTNPYVQLRDAYEQLAITPVMVNGTPMGDFLIPYEVQMGRRLDLNRPLTAYTTSNAVTTDQERTAFAQQLYVLLSLASGALQSLSFSQWFQPDRLFYSPTAVGSKPCSGANRRQYRGLYGSRFRHDGNAI